eukprot:3037362-Rhodomonas_salina.1
MIGGLRSYEACGITGALERKIGFSAHQRETMQSSSACRRETAGGPTSCCFKSVQTRSGGETWVQGVPNVEPRTSTTTTGILRHSERIFQSTFFCESTCFTFTQLLASSSTCSTSCRSIHHNPLGGGFSPSPSLLLFLVSPVQSAASMSRIVLSTLLFAACAEAFSNAPLLSSSPRQRDGFLSALTCSQAGDVSRRAALPLLGGAAFLALQPQSAEVSTPLATDVPAT